MREQVQDVLDQAVRGSTRCDSAVSDCPSSGALVKLASMKIALKCTQNVLRYTNSRCKANFWNRNVNAARNKLELLRSGLKGLRAFRRDSH